MVGIIGLAFTALTTFFPLLFGTKKGDKPTPTLTDETTYTRNMPVPLIYGRYKFAGTVIWIGDIHVEEADVGKSKNSNQGSTWVVYFDFCCGLGEGVFFKLLQIYVDDSVLPTACVSGACTTYFFDGDNAQTILSAVSDYLTDGSAVPWRYTSYFYISGYAPQQNRSLLPNVSVDAIGIVNDYTSPWEAHVYYPEVPPSEPVDSFFHFCDYHFNRLGIVYGIYLNPSLTIDDITIYGGIHTFNASTYDSDIPLSGIDLLVPLSSMLTEYTQIYIDDITRTGNVYFFYWYGVLNKYSIGYFDTNNNYTILVEEVEIEVPEPYSITEVIWCKIGSKIWFIYTKGDGVYASQLWLAIFNRYTGGLIDFDAHYFSEFSLYAFLEYFIYLWGNENGGIRFYMGNTDENGDDEGRGTYGRLYFYELNDQYEHIRKYTLFRYIKNPDPLTFEYKGEGDRSIAFLETDTIYLNGNKYTLRASINPSDLDEGCRFGLYQNDCEVWGMDYSGEYYSFWTMATGVSKLNLFFNRGWSKKNSITAYNNKIYFYSVDEDLYSYDTGTFEVVNETTSNVGQEIEFTHFPWNGYTWTIADFGSLFGVLNLNDSGVISMFRLKNEVDDYMWVSLKTYIDRTVTPVWVLYDFLTNERYGCGISANEIDGDCFTLGTSFANEHSHCQELVYDGIVGYDPRYLYDNAFINKMKGYDVIKDILQTCKGILYYSDGKLKIKLQKPDEIPSFYLGYDFDSFTSNSLGTETRVYADFSDFPIGYWNGDIGSGIDAEYSTGLFSVKFLIINQIATYADVEILEIVLTELQSLYFSDDFESGNLDNWTVTLASICTDPDYVYAGDYSAQVGYIEKYFIDFIPGGESDAGYFEGYFKFKDISTNQFGIAGSDLSLNPNFVIYVIGGHFYYLDEMYSTQLFPIDTEVNEDDWFKIKVEWDVGSSIFKVYVDDVDISDGGLPLITVSSVASIAVICVDISDPMNPVIVEELYMDNVWITHGSGGAAPDPDDFVFPNNWDFTVVKDNIKKDSFQYNKKDISEKFNKITIDYRDKDLLFKPNPISYENVYDINQTGEIREITHTMTGITRNSQARRMLQYFADVEEFVDWSCTVDTDILGILLNVGMIVGLSQIELSWRGKAFTIVAIEEQDNYEYKISLLEYTSTAYHDNFVKSLPIDGIFYQSMATENNSAVDHVINLFVYEDSTISKIHVLFGKPSSFSDKWIGADVSINIGDSGFKNYNFCDRTANFTRISDDITDTTTQINFVVGSLYGSFSDSGSFFIEEEEIRYSRIDNDLGIFYGCFRGYNNTVPASHSEGSYCYLRTENLFSYDYLGSDIGKVLTAKATSVNFYQVYADTSTSPEASVNVYGKYLLPYSVSDIKYTRSSNDFTVTWSARTKAVNVGYGGDYYGDNTEGYGGGNITDIVKYRLDIYNWHTNVLCRTEEISITDTEDPDGEYTYVEADNISDNGSFEAHLIFYVFQIDTNSICSPYKSKLSF
jgi:hypothetical protein